MELQDISGKQSEILSVLAAGDEGRAHTGELTETTGYPNNTVGYHVRQLISHGLAERDGETDIGAPRPAIRYRITDEGRELAEADAERRGPSIEERLGKLEDTVATRSETRETLASNVDELRDKVEELEGRVEDLEEIEARVEDLEEIDEKLDGLRESVRGVNRRLDEEL